MTRLKSVPTVYAISKDVRTQKADVEDGNFLLQIHNAVKNLDIKQAINLLKQTDMIKLFIFNYNNPADRPTLFTVQQHLGRVNPCLNQNQHCPYVLYALLLPMVEKPQFYFKYFSDEELKNLYEIIRFVQLQGLTKPNKDKCDEKLSELNKNLTETKDKDMVQTFVRSYHRVQIIKDVADLWPDAEKIFSNWVKALESYQESQSKTPITDEKTSDDLAPYEIVKLIHVAATAITQKTLEDISYYLPSDAIVQKKSKVGSDKLYLKRDYLEQFKTIFMRDYYKKAQRVTKPKTAATESTKHKSAKNETAPSASIATKPETIKQTTSSERTTEDLEGIEVLERQALSLSTSEDEIYAKHKTEKNSEERAKLRDELGRISDQRAEIEQNIIELRKADAKVKSALSEYNKLLASVKAQIRNQTKIY